MHLHEWYDLTRLDHGILWGTAVLVGEFLAYRKFPPLHFAILGFAIPVLVEVGIFALNDYLDLEADILNKRSDRPLTRDVIPQQYPLYLSLAVLPLAVMLGVIMGLAKPFFILMLFVILGILYNVKLKELPIMKNLIMGLCIAAPFVGGNLVVREDILPIIVVLGAAAFTAGFGREVLKDMIDTVGDRAQGCQTFPILLGLKPSAFIVSSLLLAAGIFVLLPFFCPLDSFYFHDIVYLIPASATLIIIFSCTHSILKDRSQENLRLLRKRTLYMIEMGIATFIIGIAF